jgi:diphthamide synthase (EF-2-diphthine--ammonia ligase)
MKWSDAPSMLANIYESFAQWSFRNEVELDVITVAVVIGIIVIVLKEKRRRRRRLHRLFWGMLMKRKDREKYQLLRFEDAIVDAAMEMVSRGDMTSEQEKNWFEFFAEKYDMKGLLPVKNVKRAIELRLKFKKMFGLLPLEIPGGKPEVKVDASYQPIKDTSSLAKSKFLEV